MPVFFGKTLPTMLPLTLLYGILMAVVNYYNAAPIEQTPHSGLKILISIICSFLGMMILVAMFVRMNGKLTGKPVSLGDAILTGIKRFISVIYWYFIMFFMIGLPIALLIFIGHYLHSPLNFFIYALALVYLLIAMIYLYVSFPLLAAENVIATTAIKQSYRLVKKQWWHTFFIALISVGILIVPEGILYKRQLLNNPLAIFIMMTFITSFACGISLIQLRHLRAYHKLHDSPPV